MKYLEHQLQKECLRWFAYQHQLFKDVLFAIPNARKTNIKQGGRLKSEGVKAGIPDLFLPIARKGFHGLFIEMKSEKGIVSDNQKYMIERLIDCGYKVEVVNSFDMFEKIMNDYLEYK